MCMFKIDWFSHIQILNEATTTTTSVYIYIEDAKIVKYQVRSIDHSIVYPSIHPSINQSINQSLHQLERSFFSSLNVKTNLITIHIQLNLKYELLCIVLNLKKVTRKEKKNLKEHDSWSRWYFGLFLFLFIFFLLMFGPSTSR